MNRPATPSMFSRVCRSHGTGVMAGRKLEIDHRIETLRRELDRLEAHSAELQDSLDRIGTGAPPDAMSAKLTAIADAVDALEGEVPIDRLRDLGRLVHDAMQLARA